MAAKRKLKPGFVWRNAKGEQEPNTTEVDANDPAIKGQEQKFEDVPAEKPKK